MIAVIFEVVPGPGHLDTYLNVASALRQQLQDIQGFVSIERFQSLSDPAKILSLSFWRDEKAVEEWRRLDSHRSAQHLGREVLFQDYRLRVAAVMRDYSLHDRREAPPDSRTEHA